MEKEVIFKTQDNKKIFTMLRGGFDKPTIIIVHGLSSHMNEALHYNAARFFEKQGFSVLRINLYSWEKGARKMDECTLQIHGKDIDTVIDYLQSKGVKKIFAIGHSYGAPSILHSSHQKLKGIVFWDGSYQTIRDYFKKMKYIPTLKGRIMDEGYHVILGEKMVQESMRINSKKLIEKVSVPIKFICAGNGGLIRAGQAMYKVAKNKKSFSLIKAATHNFSEDGKQEKLYNETLKWLKELL